MASVTLVIGIRSSSDEGYMSEIIGSLTRTLNTSNILLFDETLE